MLKQLISIILILSLICNSSLAIEHPSVKILTYDSEIPQEPGTTKTYQVTVKNTGDVPLDSVYLSLFFLPSTWYKLEKGVRLEIDETKTLNYSLSPSPDASGSITYKLTANAIRGFGIVSTSTVPVTLNLQKAQPVQTTTATRTNETALGVEIEPFDSNLFFLILIIAVSVIISLVFYKIV